MIRLLPCLALLACASPDEGTEPVETDSTTGVEADTLAPDTDTPAVETDPPEDTAPPACPELLSSVPEADQEDVPRGAALSFLFDRRGDVEVDLSTDGLNVQGSQRWSGKTLNFTPRDRLQPGAEYLAELDWSCQTAEVVFHTAGDALDPSTLIGRTYKLNIAAGTWTNPQFVGPFLAALFGTNILVQISSVGPGTLDFVMAASTPAGDQRLEFETATLLGVDFSRNPRFSHSGPMSLGGALTGFLQSADITGRVAAGGTELEDMRIVASVDTRPLETLIGFPNPGGFCALIGPIAACQPCRGGNFCLDVDVRNLVATEVPGATITYVSTTDPAALCGTVTTGWWGLGLLAWCVRRRRPSHTAKVDNCSA